MKTSSRIVVLATVLGLSAVGCSSPSTSVEEAASATAPAVADAALECAESAAPLLTLERQSPQEPVLSIPQPSGWVRATELDSEMIRGVIVNAGLRANDFSPNAVVTLEELTGGVDSAQQALAAERNGITHAGIAIESNEPATLCGYPSTTITYTLENRPVTALIVAAEHGSKIYAAVVTVQTTEPDNPTYVHDTQTILDGFQFSFPGGRGM